MDGFARMTVAARLAAGFGIAIGLGLLIAVFGAMRMHALAAQLDEVSNNCMVKVDKFTTIKDNLNAIARATRNIVISHDPAQRAQEKAKIAEARRINKPLYDELDGMLGQPQSRALLKTINETRPGYNAALDRVIELAEKEQPEEAAQLLFGEVREKQGVLFKAVDESVDNQQDLAMKLAHEARESATGSSLLLSALAAAMAVVGTLVGWLIARSLRQALGAEPVAVSEAVRRVAAGDLATPLSVRAGDAQHRGRRAGHAAVAGPHRQQRAQQCRERGHGQRPDRAGQCGPEPAHRGTGQRAAADRRDDGPAWRHRAPDRRQRAAGRATGDRRF